MNPAVWYTILALFISISLVAALVWNWKWWEALGAGILAAGAYVLLAATLVMLRA